MFQPFLRFYGRRGASLEGGRGGQVSTLLEILRRQVRGRRLRGRGRRVSTLLEILPTWLPPKARRGGVMFQPFLRFYGPQ